MKLIIFIGVLLLLTIVNILSNAKLAKIEQESKEAEAEAARALLEVKKSQKRKIEQLEKLIQTREGYEATGLTPEQIREMDRLYREKCEELAGKWIPAKMRLPNEQEVAVSWRSDVNAGEFIVMINDALLPTHLYFGDGIWIDENRNYYKVVAWMPLPEPYRGKADE